LKNGWILSIPYTIHEGRLERANPRGGVGQFADNQFFRFRYPNTYKRDIAITKFERDVFIDPNTRGSTKNTINVDLQVY